MKSKLLTVFAYEFKKIVKTKTFIILTIIGPFLMAAMLLVPAFFSSKMAEGGVEHLNIGIYIEDSSSAVQNTIAQDFIAALQTRTDFSSETFLLADEAELQAKTHAEKLDGYVSIGGSETFKYYTQKLDEIAVFSFIEDIFSDIVISMRFTNAGLNMQEITALTEPVKVPVFAIGSDTTNEEDIVTNFLVSLLLPMGFALMIYMSVLLYGQMIGRSVVMEKSSKIVDVLLSSVSPSDLLMGKIFGVGLAGLLQYSIWIFVGIISRQVIGSLMGFEFPVQLSVMNFLYLGIFFVLGYTLFGACFAALGAASEDEQHLAQLSSPFIISLIFPLVLMTGLIESPMSTLSIAFALFPLTSPMVMLALITTGEMPLHLILLSIAILLVSIFIVIKLAAKIFRVGILMNGKNFTFKDIGKWLKAQ